MWWWFILGWLAHGDSRRHEERPTEPRYEQMDLGLRVPSVAPDRAYLWLRLGISAAVVVGLIVRIIGANDWSTAFFCMGMMALGGLEMGRRH